MRGVRPNSMVSAYAIIPTYSRGARAMCGRGGQVWIARGDTALPERGSYALWISAQDG